MTMERRKIGELDCAVVDSPDCDQQIKALVVLCHGFGAPGEDLVPCAPELYSACPDELKGVRFVFPAAPIQMDPSGLYDSRAWWPIDMIKLQAIMESGEIRDMRQERPELLDQRNSQLSDVLAEITTEAGLGYDQVVLGGFSQGSMLATDVALSLPDMIGGLIVWSGTLLSEATWRERATVKSGLRVIQTHGRIDPVLPYVGAELLKEMFEEHGIETDFTGFQGQHTIPREAIEKASRMIAEVAG